MSRYTPAIDDLVFDEATNKVGRVVDRIGGYWQLRPPGGGREGDAHGPLRPASPSEQLSCDAAPASATSRGERL